MYWQPFWILQEKVGISFYFWIIRLVYSQHCTVMSDVTPSMTTPNHLPHANYKFCNYEGLYLPGVICNIVVKADLDRWTSPCYRAEMPSIPVHKTWQMNILWQMDSPKVIEHRCLESIPLYRSCQMHHGIYIMGCIWQPFWILQEQEGNSFSFLIIRVVNSQLALYSHVRCNPPWHPWNTPKHPQMTITNFNYEGWYLPGLICNIVVKLILADVVADLPPKMHHGIYIMGCIWQPFWILQEKVQISSYFWIIRLVNSQLALYSHVRCNPLNTPKTPPHDNYKFCLWGLIFVRCNM